MQRSAWQNWARTVTAAPRAWHAVSAEADVQRLLAQATAQRRRVKVVGSGHSWSAVAQPEDWLLDLSALRRPLAVDRARCQVRVQAGITLSDLNRWLTREGLSLSIMGSVTAQTLAGAISTATHGSSLRHGNLASAVVGMRLVTPQGDLLTLASDDPLLPAARVSLGALGVITEVTLQVEPAFSLEEVVTVRPWAQAMRALPDEVHAQEYIKYWWLPHTDSVLTSLYRRVRDRAPTFSPRARKLDDLLNAHGFRAILALGDRYPRAIPTLNRLVRAAYFKPRQQVGRADQVLPLSMPPRHREAEVAFPLTHAVEGFQALRDLIERQHLRVNFIAEARFVPADDAWLSPAYGRDVCQLGAYVSYNPDADTYLRDAEAALLSFDGRPHWGKETSLPPSDLLRRYPRGADFRALAQRLDPHKTLSNPFLAALLR
jgi:L-gulono-1,4-lactone dehydrogenase